jgi:hypothetical protein
MAFLVGGYITYKDVEDWCERHNLGRPNLASLTLTPNRWLKVHNLPTRLLAVDHHGESMIMAITDWKIDSNATRTNLNFAPFEQTERALPIPSM